MGRTHHLRRESHRHRRRRHAGTKDRSWGVRPIAGADPAIAPAAPSELQVFFLWAPLHWEDRCTHFGAFENRHGRMWHFDGALVPVYDDIAAIPGAEDPATEVLRRANTTSPTCPVPVGPGTRRFLCCARTANAKTSTSNRCSVSA